MPSETKPGKRICGNVDHHNAAHECDEPLGVTEKSTAPKKPEVKHTAMPWHQGGTKPEELMSPNTIFGKDGSAIATFFGISLHRTLEEIDKDQCAEGLGNIATVLRAVNAFDQMRKALERLKSYNEDIAAGRINYRPEDHIAIAEAAIRAAGGKDGG